MGHKFLCPLPWISLSLGARNTPRVCCHANSKSASSSFESDSLQHLNHNLAIRQEMLAGEIPSMCIGCHRLEQAGVNSPRLDYLERFSFDQNAKPIIKYLDLTIDNDCNLECVMCSPAYSHRLTNFAIKSLGATDTSKWSTSITNQNLDIIIPALEMLTITGGEPLISPKSREIIKYVSRHPRASEITLRLFTNITHIPEKLLEDIEKFKTVEMILSIDSVGENYEFIRYPAKWKNIERNVNWLNDLKSPKLDFHVHCVVTAINWPHMGDLIGFYHQQITSSRILPLFVTVETPIFLHPRVLPEDEFNSGKDKFIAAIRQLIPKSEQQKNQIIDAYNLVEDISKAQHIDRYIDYRFYLKKIASHRNRSIDANVG